MISKITLAEPACAIPPPALPACHEYIFLFSESSAVDAPVSRCVNARKLYAHGVPVSFISRTSVVIIVTTWEELNCGTMSLTVYHKSTYRLDHRSHWPARKEATPLLRLDSNLVVCLASTGRSSRNQHHETIGTFVPKASGFWLRRCFTICPEPHSAQRGRCSDCETHNIYTTSRTVAGN